MKHQVFPKWGEERNNLAGKILISEIFLPEIFCFNLASFSTRKCFWWDIQNTRIILFFLVRP